MESSAYPMLFSPIKVGTTEVKNRVFMPPVSTNLADHGYVTDDLVDHYRARAKGGVGLIITEVVTVEPVSYTHLDVYKRQLLRAMGLLQELVRFEEYARFECVLGGGAGVVGDARS